MAQAHLLVTLTGTEDDAMSVYENDDGTYTVAIMKKRGSTKFTCQGTDYVAAHHKAFPQGTVPQGETEPATRMTY